MMKKKLVVQTFIILAGVLLSIVVLIGFLYYQHYLPCITQDTTLCFQSKKYVSVRGNFSFRYPKNYPITYKTGDQMIRQYFFEDGYVEWVNFSGEFYPNSGGDRLGSVIVTKNTIYKDIYEYVSKKPSNSKNRPEFAFIKIGGNDAACTSTKEQRSTSIHSNYDCFVVEGEMLYQISFNYNDYYHKLPVEYYWSAQQLILSTFSIK